MMRPRHTGLLVLVLALLPLAPATLAEDSAGNAALGMAAVAGVVTDDSGSPIPGVTVTATRSGEQAGQSIGVTETNGRFRIADLRPGTYHVDALLDGFQPVATNVKLVTSQTLAVAFKLVPAFGETVEVVGKAVHTGEVAVLESRREAPVVSDSISAEEIKKTPDSNAAGVVERLTGVTLLADKYVFVRGLGERYSGTTINGATLPTTETEKRVVPLDLFPAKLLQTVNVVKTYTPDKPADFGSGVVEMTTTEFPGAQSLRFTVGAGYLSSATGNAFRRYSGGLDSLGRGGQPIPDAIPSEFVQRKSALSNTGFTPAELQAIGQAMVGDWTGSTLGSASPAMDFALTYGNTLGRLGVVLSAVTNHKYNTTNEVQRFFGLDAGDILVPRNDFDLTTDRESVTAGAVTNLSFRLTDNNRIFLNTILTRDAANENRVQTGINGAQGGEIRDYRVRYQLEQVFSSRLRGEHNLSGPGAGSLVEWSVARSRATNDSDLRENVYREAEPGKFDLEVGFSASGEIDYYNLDDDIEQGGVSYTTFFAPETARWSGSLKAGYDHLRRTRDFGTRRFAFTTPNPTQFDLTLTPDELFIPANIRPGGFEIREVTGINDAYDAEHTVDAGYLMTDATLGRWRFIGGGRFETSDQRVTTFNPFDLANLVEGTDNENDLLPSLNVVYQRSNATNLRFGYGRTVNRPEFRELSPFAFTEVAGGRSVAGNPNLVEATLDSYDLRWETFPGAGEVFAASAFYKNIDRPIERIVQPTSDFRTSFINADSASLYGLELEVRRNLGVFVPFLANWAVNANYAWIHSSVNVGPDLAAATSGNRTLQGQADQSANLALQYTRGGMLVRFLGAYIGRRLTDVGAFGLPDIFEEPYTTFDAVLSQRIDRVANGLEIKLAASNIFDKKHEFTESGLIQRAYDPGRTISLSLSYTPF